MTSCNKPDPNRLVVDEIDKLIDKLKQAGKFDHLEQVCGLFDCVWGQWSDHELVHEKCLAGYMLLCLEFTRGCSNAIGANTVLIFNLSVFPWLIYFCSTVHLRLKYKLYSPRNYFWVNILDLISNY